MTCCLSLTAAAVAVSNKRYNYDRCNDTDNNHRGCQEVDDDVHRQFWIIVLGKSNGPKECHKAKRNSWNDNMANCVKELESVTCMEFGIVFLQGLHLKSIGI